MSRSGEITLPWGDEDHVFRLDIKAWEKVQEKCDAGPAEIHARLAPMFAATEAGLSLKQILASGYMGTWRVNDVREVLYQGKIGGGATPTEAGAVIRLLVDERPLIESVVLAYQVATAGIMGAPDEVLGEPKGETTTILSPEEKSASVASTGSAARSASRRRKSVPAPSGS